MGNLFFDLPVPAGDGVGAAVDVTTLGRTKTITVQGDLKGTITVEISLDGATFYPLKSFAKKGKMTDEFAAQYMRVRVSGYKSGSGNVDVGSEDFGQLFAALPTTAGDGVGAAVDVSALGTLNTIGVAGDFSGTVTLEISEDNVSWTQCMSFTKPGFKTREVVAQYMRVRRSGVSALTPGSATVNVGAVNDSAGAAPPVGPAGGDLSGTYPNPLIARPRLTYVFQPGGVASNNVYTSWATLYAAVNATAGLREILFDESFAPIVIPPGVWNMKDVIWRAYPELGALFGFTLITVADGAIFTGLRYFHGPMFVQGLGTVPHVSDLGDNDIVYMREGADITQLGPAPFFDTPLLTTSAAFQLDDIASLGFFGPGTVVNLANPGTFVGFNLGIQGVVSAATLSGAPGSFFRIIYTDTSAYFGQSQPAHLGTFQLWVNYLTRYYPQPDPPALQTTPYTPGIYSEVVRCDASGGPVPITLPNIAANFVQLRGLVVGVKETTGNAGVTVVGGGGDTIDGAAPAVPIPAGGAIFLMSDGISNWDVLDIYDPAAATPPTRYAPPEKWYQINVPAAQSAVDLSALMSVSFDTIKAIRAGSIVGLSTRFTQAITDATANSAVVKVTVNGAAGTLQVAHSSGSNPSGGEATQAAGVDTFNAGDLLGIEITTLGSFAPTTTDVEAWLDLEF